MKIIKLTESELTKIIKRVINESKKSLMEEVIVDNVIISPTNTQSGGPVFLEYKGIKTKYKITAKVTKTIDIWGIKKAINVYEGPIGVINIWKNGSEIWIKDNTNKTLKLSDTEIQKMVAAAKTKSTQFTIAGVGKMYGEEGNFNATLTKIS